MAALARFERGCSTRVPLDLHSTLRVDALDRAQLAIRTPALAVGRGHLPAISCRERAMGFLIERYALQPAWVIGKCAVVVRSDGHLIHLRVHAFDARVVARLNAERPAATAVTNDVTLLVSFRPLPIGPGNLLPLHQHGRSMLLAIDLTLAVHGPVNHLVEILSRLVVR